MAAATTAPATAPAITAAAAATATTSHRPISRLYETKLALATPLRKLIGSSLLVVGVQDHKVPYGLPWRLIRHLQIHTYVSTYVSTYLRKYLPYL